MPCSNSSGFLGQAVVLADAGHHAHALRLDEDLAFVALIGPDLLAVGVVGAQEPFAVPAGGLDSLDHLRLFAADKGGLVLVPGQLAQLGVVVRHADEHAGDKDALGDAGVVVGDGLEALAGLLGEAVQVQAVVPVKQFRFRQSFQSARPISGRPWGPRWSTM